MSVKVLTVIGTRPEAIKLCPVVLELQKRVDEFESVVCVTAQLREMLDQISQNVGHFYKADWAAILIDNRQAAIATNGHLGDGGLDVIIDRDADGIRRHYLFDVDTEVGT